MQGVKCRKEKTSLEVSFDVANYMQSNMDMRFYEYLHVLVELLHRVGDI